MELSKYGKIVNKEIEETPAHYENIKIDKHIVMPNHVHMIVLVNKDGGVPRASRPTTTLIPNIIAALKKKTNKAIGNRHFTTILFVMKKITKTIGYILTKTLQNGQKIVIIQGNKIYILGRRA